MGRKHRRASIQTQKARRCESSGSYQVHTRGEINYCASQSKSTQGRAGELRLLAEPPDNDAPAFLGPASGGGVLRKQRLRARSDFNGDAMRVATAKARASRRLLGKHKERA